MNLTSINFIILVRIDTVQLHTCMHACTHTHTHTHTHTQHQDHLAHWWRLLTSFSFIRGDLTALQRTHTTSHLRHLDATVHLVVQLVPLQLQQRESGDMSFRNKAGYEATGGCLTDVDWISQSTPCYWGFFFLEFTNQMFWYARRFGSSLLPSSVVMAYRMCMCYIKLVTKPGIKLGPIYALLRSFSHQATHPGSDHGYSPFTSKSGLSVSLHQQNTDQVKQGEHHWSIQLKAL